METSATTIARIQTAKENETLVLVEASLAGQKFVAVMRVVLSVALALSTEVIARFVDDNRVPEDWVRRVAGSFYTVAAVGVIFLLRRSPLSARGALIGQIWRAVLDFSFLCFMGLRTEFVGSRAQPPVHPSPAIGAVVVAVVLCFAIASFSWINALVSTVLACACFTVYYLFIPGISNAALSFVLTCYLVQGLLIGATSGYVRQMFVNLRKRDYLKRLLAPSVAEQVLKLGEVALAPVQREVTILFSDIRDFTAFAETLAPRVVLQFLDDYFGHMSHIVKEHGGTVGKLIGDGMLAFWNVPDRQDDHAERALRAALDMRKKLVELNAMREQQSLPPIRIGIGIHTGTVAAGSLGGADQHEYTVIGDAVNLASRIEGLTKAHRVDILVSENTWNLAGGRFRGDHVGEERVKGRNEPVVVYALRERLPADKVAAVAG